MSNGQRVERRRSGAIAFRVALIAMSCVALLAAVPGGVPIASAAPSLSISTSPSLMRPFDPAVSDYTVRCGKSLTAPSTVTVSVSAPAGTTVSVAGATPQSGSFNAKVIRAWDQSFALTAVKSHTAPVKYYVRCLSPGIPAISAVRSGTGTPGADYYLLSAYASPYIAVVDTNGVPLWWYNTTAAVGDYKILPNGTIAWLPAGSPTGVMQMPLSGTPVTNVPVPDNPYPDPHDFEALPNGNWLMESYVYVTGVDLSSIGGSSNTCMLDGEVEEVTPAGQLVWRWFASQHLALTEMSPNVQARVASSTCGAPVDAWHLNSLEPFADGDLLVSLRFANAVYRIDRDTGNVVWKLGGAHIPESLTIEGDPLNGFIGQHDARMWPDGSVSVFDNGADGAGAYIRAARMVRYQIDTDAGTATMVQQIHDPLIRDPATCCGSARLLPNGNWAIGYGQLDVNTEVTSSGDRVLSFTFPGPKNIYTYRMTPVLPGTITANQLRSAMDAMHTPAPATPSGVPSGNGAAKVIWKAPARNGSAAITGYIVTPYLGKAAQRVHTFRSTATSQLITGLHNAAGYQFTVTATTALGASAPSAKSANVVVGTPGRPGRPTLAKVGPTTLTVRFAAPLGNGAKITRYIVACISADGGRAKNQTGPTATITVTGLTADKRYTCTVQARNNRGFGPKSLASAAATA